MFDVEWAFESKFGLFFDLCGDEDVESGDCVVEDELWAEGLSQGVDKW